MRSMRLAGIRRGKKTITTVSNSKAPCPLDKVNQKLREASGLRLDKEGRFWHRGGPIEHERTVASRPSPRTSRAITTSGGGKVTAMGLCSTGGGANAVTPAGA